MKKSGGNKKKALSYKTFVPVLIAVLITAFFAFGGTHNSAFVSLQKWFAAGQTPAHSKTIENNEDGTWKLELSVTGDADTKVETAANVNVLIVYDESSSMTSNNVTTNPNRNRADYAEDIMHDFIVNLRQYQGTDDPSNIEVALVGFGASNTAEIRQSWTSNLADTGQGINRFFDDGVDGTVTSSHGYTNNNGTNWQAALQQAENVLEDLDDKNDKDPTFVILVTDGAPTAARGQTTINPGGNHQWTDFRVYYDAATDEARSIQTRENTTLFGIYAYGREADLLDELIYYSNNGSHRVINGYNVSTCNANQHNFGTTEETDNYYNAANTSALTEAIEDIFQTIVKALGVAQVQITDGTTNQVQTTTEVKAELLDIVPNSYQYWISIPVVNNQFQRVNLVSGENETYTVTDNHDGTCTVTWGSNSVTVNGSVSGGQLKYEWTEANKLYNYNPPAADFNNGAVEWDLSSVDALLDGVTYSITFDVYPSQYTYDTIADIKNEKNVFDRQAKYEALDSNIRQYLIPARGHETTYDEFELKTNTEATLSYVDTRTGQSGSSDYTNPDPVSTSDSTISIHKEWNNIIPDDPRQGRDIEVELLCDDSDFYPATLTKPTYTVADIHIATGSARLSDTGVLTVLAPGHDYHFAELGSEAYYWELETETVHPMLINGTPTKLVLVEDEAEAEAAEAEMGENNYYSDGTNKYYKLLNGKVYVEQATDPSVKAINHRRSNLNVKKIVDTSDQTVTPDDEFTFTIDVRELDEEGNLITSEDHTYHNDYLWFSVQDAAENWVDYGENGISDWARYVGTDDKTGKTTYYYYAPNGTNLSIKLKADYNLRFTNLPKGTEFTVTESTEDLGDYKVGKIEEKVTYKEEQEGVDPEDWEITTEIPQSLENTNTLTGTVTDTNKSYAVEVTNVYEKVNINVKKAWVGDNDGAEGLRSEVIFNLKNGEEIVDTVTLDGTESPAWEGSFEEQPRFSNNDEITYTIEEVLGDLAEHYTSEVTEEDGLVTVTNTRIPKDEVTTVKVVKVWDDDTNHDGFRPTSLKVKLNDKDETVVTLNEGNNWTGTVENLPKYSNGNLINYSWTEVDLPDEYTEQTPATATTTVDGITVVTITLTNKHESVYVDIPVEKVWLEDDNGSEGLRTSVTVELLKGKTSLGTKTLNETNGWKNKFEHIAKYENGEAIEYSLKEVEVPHYTTDIDFDEETYTFTVTNTREDDKTIDIPVEKIWVGDNNDEQGLRTPITVTLKNGNTTVGTKTLSASNNWKDKFTDLPKYENGAEIEYTLTENYTNPHYRKGEVEGSTKDGFTVTNTRIPDDVTTKASVFKVWDDDRNHDGFRPQSLRVQLNDKDNTVVTLNSGNEWKATVGDLPKYANGQEVTYTWTELNLPSQYTQQTPVVTNIEEDGKVVGKLTTITNKHESVYINIPVEKVWLKDDNGSEGLRTAVTVKLLKGTETVGTKTLTNDNNWKGVFEHVAKYEDGEEIEYDLEEVKVDHYTTDITFDEKTGTFTVTNTREDDKTIDIPVEKIWVGDNNDEQGLRTPITVTLKNGNTTVGTKTLSASNNWKDKFTDLPKYENGAEIEYTLTEDYTNTHYEIGEVEGSTKEGFTVINTRIPEDITIKYTVKKIWDDSDDQDGIRPDSITVTLTGTVKERDNNGNLTDTDKVAYPAEEVTVSKPEGAATNEWSVTVENLPKYADGQLITYTISEEQVDDYDKPEIDGNEVTNPHNPFETKVTVIKKWDDKNNQDGLRDEVTFMLTNDKGLLIPGAHKDVTFKLTDENVDSEGNWVTSKEGLPRRSAGEEIEYSVVEISRPAGYTAKDGDPKVEKSKTDDKSGAQEFTITYTNVHETATVDVEGVKEWNDDSNRDVVRPQSIYVTLTGTVDGEIVKTETKLVTSATAVEGNPNQWAYSFTGLDEFYNGGKTITYTITETDENGNEIEKLPNYEAPEYFGDYSVRNTHTNEPTSLSGKKVWEDDGNRDALRPTTITVEVYDVDDPNTIVASKEVTGSMTGAEWSYEFTGLNKNKNVNGTKTPITYKVKEVNVPDGYTSKVEDDGTTITNTYTPEKTQISGKKVWVDDGNRDALRPTTITIEVYDVDDPNTVVASKEVSGDMTADDWSYTITGLPANKNVNGKATPITYKVKEVSLPTGYTSKVEDDGTTITNTHETAKIDVPVSKTWIDSNDKEKHRPTEITVYLYDDKDVKVGETKLNAENGWEDTFENLPANRNVNGVATPITYRAEEVITDQIREFYDVDVVENTAIINTIKDLSKDIPVAKIWNDANNQDGKRKPVTITLSGTISDKDGNVINVETDKVPKTITLTEENLDPKDSNRWVGVFENVPIFYQGSWITYQITEAEVADYSVTAYGTEDDGTLTVTNTHQPEQAVYSASKVWNDDDDNDDRRPDSVTFALMAGENEVQRLVASEENGWKVTFDAVPVYKEGAVGQKITYTVTEPDLDSNYTMSEDIATGETEYDFIITNDHEPMTITYNVQKIWDDWDNQSGDRPESITVRIYESTDLENEVASKVITEASGWSCTFEGLPKYRNKQLIQYVITEDNVDLYKEPIITQVEQERDTTELNNTVTNPKDRVPYNDTGEITVNKYWKDEENKYKKRPKSVTIELLADGEVIATADLTEANEWTYTFTGLWKYKEGEVGVEIKYSIRELAVEYYKTTIDGFDVYNTYDGPVPEITPPNTGVMMVKDNNNNVLFEMIATVLATSYTIVVARRKNEQ